MQPEAAMTEPTTEIRASSIEKPNKGAKWLYSHQPTTFTLHTSTWRANYYYRTTAVADTAPTPAKKKGKRRNTGIQAHR